MGTSFLTRCKDDAPVFEWHDLYDLAPTADIAQIPGRSGSNSRNDDVLLQDVAIAYGYNNVGLSVPATVTVGKELPLNQLVELLRVECAMCGFTEILTWALCSRSENFEYLRRQDDGNTAVSIGNPATAEFEVCRTSLLQGMPPGSSHTCCLQLCT